MSVKIIPISQNMSLYPASLQSTYTPSVLYCRGNVPLLSQGGVAVIGTRKPSKQSIQLVQDYIHSLDSNTVVISGLALGTDAIAHKTALDCGLPTIAVLPCGVDFITPYSNYGLAQNIVNSGGLLVSEYPQGVRPNRGSFVQRNRITAGLADRVVVGECNAHSGTMHTVRFARSYNKPVYAFDLPASGNQHILSTGGLSL